MDHIYLYHIETNRILAYKDFYKNISSFTKTTQDAVDTKIYLKQDDQIFVLYAPGDGRKGLC